MVRVFWMVAGKLPIDVWVGRLGTKVNPDELPARYAKLPFLVLNRAQIT